MADTTTDDLKLDYEPGSCAGSVSQIGISLNEKVIGSRLDPAYLRQLEVCNGGVPRKRYFPVPGNVKVIERFLCVIDDYRQNKKHGPYDVGVVYTQIVDRLNRHQMPFAALFGGDFLLFEGAGDLAPCVVLWDHERSREGASVTTPVADDFTSFLPLLYEDDDEDDEDDE